MIGESGGTDGWVGFSSDLVVWVVSEVPFCGSWVAFPALGIGPFDDLDGGVGTAWISSRTRTNIGNLMRSCPAFS